MKKYSKILFVLALPVFLGLPVGAVEPAPAVVEIPAGPFIAGSNSAEREAAYRLDEAAYGHGRTREWGWYDSERKRRSVETGAYRITRTLITNAQYLAFVEATGHEAPGVSTKTWDG